MAPCLGEFRDRAPVNIRPWALPVCLQGQPDSGQARFLGPDYVSNGSAPTWAAPSSLHWYSFLEYVKKVGKSSFGLFRGASGTKTRRKGKIPGWGLTFGYFFGGLLGLLDKTGNVSVQDRLVVFLSFFI